MKEVGLQKDVKCKLTIKRNKRGRMLLSLKGPGFLKMIVTRNKNTVSVFSTHKVALEMSWNQHSQGP